MNSCLIRGGMLIDGTGAAGYRADIRVEGGVITDIAANIEARDEEQIQDATGCIVAPGFIETPMTGVLDEGQKANLLTRVPAGRLGKPAEIAASVVFLASDEAAYVTGMTMHVNGGMAML